MCVLEKEWRVKGYLQTETNQCVWDKKAAFMVYGNQHPPGLPPTCIITTTYSHDWWNMRLWNPSCFCYHPVFPLSPRCSLPLNLFFLSCSTSLPLSISPLLCSGQRCLEHVQTRNYTHSMGCHLKVCVHKYTHYFSLFNMMHEEKTTASEEEYEEPGKGNEKASKRGYTVIILSCRETGLLDWVGSSNLINQETDAEIIKERLKLVKQKKQGHRKMPRLKHWVVRVSQKKQCHSLTSIAGR